jgi:transmembrane sensor
MDDHEQKTRDAIAQDAAERFIANDDGPLDAQDAAELAAWLKASPAHIEALLGAAAIARDLPELRSDPEYSVEAIVERARAEEDRTVQPFWPRPIVPAEDHSVRRWPMVALAMSMLATLCAGLVWMWHPKSSPPDAPFSGTTALHFETRHGEQLTRRLTDDTVLHLNTDSAVTIRYGKTERLVMLTSGQANFEVAHEPNRAFRVFAGAAEVIAIGTKFDVRLEGDATVVTMVEGRVAVGRSSMAEGANSGTDQPMRFVELGPDQQIKLVSGEWPPQVIAVDSQRDTAWLRRQIVFDHEPLKTVAAEFNRYATKPITIMTPALQNLQISGTFATDDTQAFIAFLRSLKGVRVEVTATQIRVSGE